MWPLVVNHRDVIAARRETADLACVSWLVRQLCVIRATSNTVSTRWPPRPLSVIGNDVRENIHNAVPGMILLIIGAP